ncbi:MAG: peptidoglycan-associated lipoprotein Pal [Bdellovibrionaceae bacterium]|nr:peptidoglycan-associated lipoprotein Pal [Pseudobdellovibrionaceae bacterium]
MFKKGLGLVSVVVLALSLGACKSSKKVEDSGTGSGMETSSPQIDSTPLSFDAAGSDSGRIAGLNTIYFDYDKSTLSASAKKTLAANANWIKSQKTNIQIEGHCDARGSIEYNLSLGERRAQSVKAYLVSLGVASNRLSVISYGKEKPIENGDSESAYAKNRRANFVPLQ